MCFDNLKFPSNLIQYSIIEDNTINGKSDGISLIPQNVSPSITDEEIYFTFVKNKNNTITRNEIVKNFSFFFVIIIHLLT